MITIQFDSRLLAQPLAPEIPSVLKEHQLILQAPAGGSVNQTIKDLNIQLNQAVSALVNGQTTDLEQPLAPGDTVRLLPQIAGGD